jgi:hypothetical protein
MGVETEKPEPEKTMKTLKQIATMALVVVQTVAAVMGDASAQIALANKAQGLSKKGRK